MTLHVIMSAHDEETTADKCPVDHTNRAAWANLTPPSWHPPVPSASSSAPAETAAAAVLPTSRETSTIPRVDGKNWVYPSEAQFFAAMARKNHNPHAPDMRVVVPIHNAVNERAWGELMAWEAGRGGEACGGVKLVSFKGRPGDRTPKAWFKTLLGYVDLTCTCLLHFAGVLTMHAGIKHHLIDMTGSSIGAVSECDT